MPIFHIDIDHARRAYSRRRGVYTGWIVTAVDTRTNTRFRVTRDRNPMDNMIQWRAGRTPITNGHHIRALNRAWDAVIGGDRRDRDK